MKEWRKESHIMSPGRLLNCSYKKEQKGTTRYGWNVKSL